MMDMVIPMGKGSKWANNELRYCLRSIEKNVVGFRNIVIVGDLPDFLNENIIYIEQPLVFGNAARNIALNLLEACRDERLSERFAYFNDDYFVTGKIDLGNYPLYHKEPLEYIYRQNVTDYRRHVKETFDYLQSIGKETMNYDTHYPCVFEKTKLQKLIEGTDFNRSHGFILKSLYFNTYKAESTFRSDCKQYQIKPLDKWQELATATEIFSIADTCINPAFKSFLENTFPEKSKWERN